MQLYGATVAPSDQTMLQTLSYDQTIPEYFLKIRCYLFKLFNSKQILLNLKLNNLIYLVRVSINIIDENLNKRSFFEVPQTFHLSHQNGEKTAV